MPAFLRTTFAFLAAAALALPLLFGIARAQDDGADKSSFVRYIEETISTPDRQISLGQIDGALSSNVRISTITIADREGVWLRIENAHLVWSRLALFSRRLDIDLLEAEAIRILRRPLPPEGIQAAASPELALPELPVSVRIGKLSVPVVEVAAAIAGVDTTLSVDGGGQLADGALDIDLSVVRTKPSGGTLAVKAKYEEATRQLALDLNLQEPQNGFLSNLLDLPGRPSLSFKVAGSGPIDAFRADVSLLADSEPLVAGATTIRRGQEGLDFTADLEGSLGRIVPAAYADFFAGRSSLAIAARQTAQGGLVLDRADIRSGALSLSASGAFAPDGFPTSIKIDGTLGEGDGRPVLLPGGDGATVERALLAVAFKDGAWTASFDLTALSAGDVSSERAAFRAEGEASDLADSARRSLTVRLAGRAEGVGSRDASLARALGSSFELSGRGGWRSGTPLQVEEIRFANENAEARFLGRLEDATLIGTFALSSPDLSPLAGLAGVDLRGRIDLEAQGSLALVGGAFDLKLDGSSEDLAAGLAIDPLVAGGTTLSGRVARTAEGTRFEALTLNGRDAKVLVDGIYGPRTSSLRALADITDVARLTSRASGALRLEAALSGPTLEPDVVADLSASRLVLQGRPFEGGTAHFEGKLGAGGPAGSLSAGGRLAGLPIEAAARIASESGGTMRIEGISARAGVTSLTGDLSLLADGRMAGRLALSSTEVSGVAPLLLTEASGALTADIELTTPDGRQDATVNADGRNLAIETVRIGEMALDLRASDLTGSPALSGSLTAQAVSASGISLPRLTATATRAGEATRFSAQTTVTGAKLQAAGLSSLAVTASGTLSGRRVSLQARATGGGGVALDASGEVPLSGAGLDVALRGRFPLSLANVVLRERGARLTGVAAIEARVTGSLEAPKVTGSATTSGAGFSDPETGLSITGIAGAVRLEETRATVERLTGTTTGGGSLSVSGSVGLTDDVDAALDILLRKARVSDGRIVTAQVSGTLTVRGPLLGAPTIGGRIEVDRAEITIPERFAANAALLGVKHLAPPPKVRRSLERMKLADRSGGRGRRQAGDIVLDLVISAPSRVFVRGRGLDAELGGEVALRGPISNPSPVGSFRLRRGSLDVIGQRITLDQGELRLVGTLDPLIDLRASVRARTIAVTARVTGQASDPQLVLTSSPELPQDEVLSQFLFGRSINELSPFQVVQLATAVAQLAGGGSGGLLSSIRKSTGLDTLGIVTDTRGNPALQAGRYISERIYLGVTTGASGQTNATVNLDVTRNLKARVEAGTEGGSAGLFYEREY